MNCHDQQAYSDMLTPRPTRRSNNNNYYSCIINNIIITIIIINMVFFARYTILNNDRGKYPQSLKMTVQLD